MSYILYAGWSFEWVDSIIIVAAHIIYKHISLLAWCCAGRFQKLLKFWLMHWRSWADLKRPCQLLLTAISKMSSILRLLLLHGIVSWPNSMQMMKSVQHLWSASVHFFLQLIFLHALLCSDSLEWLDLYYFTFNVYELFVEDK